MNEEDTTDEEDITSELRRLSDRVDAHDARMEALIADADAGRREAREAAPVAITMLFFGLQVVIALILLCGLAIAPSFRKMFAETGVSLPAVTEVYLGYPAAIAALVVLALGGGIAALALLRRSWAGVLALGGLILLHVLGLVLTWSALFTPLIQLLQKL